MSINRVAIKFFLRPESGEISLESFIGLFHRFIQQGAVPGLLIDVADYAHVPEGPGVILIGHEVDYGMDSTRGRVGLLTTRKRCEDRSLPEIVRDTLHKASNAMKAIEEEGSTGVAFDLAGFELHLLDRLAFPNDGEAFDTVRADLASTIEMVFGAGANFERADADDSRRALSIAVTAASAPEIDALVDALGGREAARAPVVVASREWDIEVADLAKLRQENASFVLLDVREPHEYEICSLDGTQVPLGSLGERLAEFDKDAHLIVHCHKGGRGAKAVEVLREAGFTNAWNVAGGISAWIEQIDPSLTDY